ncbi:uncharacterized protein LOC121240273 [Juglans microcarpa x Juglans regia]|uniref:uncharacterized protein LOC121240273 n=1 Tax=Juglans microcarpa x Juglans regia TaxID=2249226 RepID=UPI001B7E26A3|nr:uncharacterized protein LOC121240273 [Juglans microcarpa x Juglans regia]
MVAKKVCNRAWSFEGVLGLKKMQEFLLSNTQVDLETLDLEIFKLDQEARKFLNSLGICALLFHSSSSPPFWVPIYYVGRCPVDLNEKAIDSCLGAEILRLKVPGRRRTRLHWMVGRDKIFRRCVPSFVHCVQARSMDLNN